MSTNMFGEGLGFAQAEAYKLLRTNILFSLADAKESHVIGVTSAYRNEGKSTTSINLAYEMAEYGKKVLLIECDLRVPSIGRKLHIARTPGLSNALADTSSKAIIRESGLHDNLHVITSGDIPPNPSELLSSPRMEMVIGQLKDSYDFIILDLPPVTIVADALSVSKFTDGMVVVVREHFSNKRALRETVEQLKFVDARILGFVTTYASNQGKNYKRYGKKYGYGYKYNRAYGYAYEESVAEEQKDE